MIRTFQGHKGHITGGVPIGAASSLEIFDVFHTSLLTPYKETEEHGENFPEPPPDLIDDEPENEVEEVLASQRYGCWKKLQYLL
jgi:hypothetical protein